MIDTSSQTARRRPATWTTEQAALLDRGFPHLARIVDAHADDHPKKVAKSARKIACAIDPIYFVDWPREVAGRFLRAYARGGARGSGAEGLVEVDRPGWPAASEIDAIVRSIVFPPKGGEPVHAAWGRHTYPFEVTNVVYLLEAAFGADPVLDATVGTLEEYAEFERTLVERKRVPTNYAANMLGVPIGMLLRRATPARSAAARTRFERLVEDDPARIHAVYGLHALDLVLHGRAGYARSGWKWVSPEGWLFVEDDPAWVDEAVGSAKGVFYPDVQAAWLGSDGVYPQLVKHVKKAKRTMLPHLAEGFGMLKTDGARQVMEVIAARPGGDAAAAWLLQHGGAGGP